MNEASRRPGAMQPAWTLLRYLLLASALAMLGPAWAAKTATSTVLASSVNPSALGQTTVLTATVSPAAATGSVTFKDGSTTLGSGTLSSGVATLSKSFSTAGAHTLTAVYAGASSYASSTSTTKTQTVTAQAASSTTLSANPNPAAVGQSVTFSASVSPPSATGSVTFKEGASTLGTAALNSGIANLSTSALALGSHSLSASYAGDASTAASSSSTVTLQIVTPVNLPSPPISPVPVINYEYDAQGNPTKTIQAPGVAGFDFATRASYDTLSRRKDTTDAKNGVTRFGYDGLDRTVQVTDPRNLVTQYPRNGLGDATNLISPDTGTASHTYDASGHLLTRTDSRGVLATYSYEELNRLASLTYTQSGQTPLAYSWVYDQTGAGFSYGIGRLTSTTHPSGSTQYAHDPWGHVVTEIQRVNAAAGANSSQITSTVSYGYDAGGHITSITYPSGRKLSITYTGGIATAIALAKDASSPPTTLIDQIRHAPFGPPVGWSWQMTAGSQANTRVYDLSGRIVRYQLGGFVRDIVYDAADRIASYTHYDSLQGATAAANALNQSFGYDELGRLISITTASASWSIGYDANGNRTGVTLNGNPSTYTTSPTSNRLTGITNPARSFGYDKAGNTTSDSTSYTGSYNLAGRLTTLTKAGITSTYTYDGMGRRVRKVTSSSPSSTVLFVYDQDGQLLGEYDQNGAALREYVWLGSTPVAMFTPDPTPGNPPLVYFILADHIDTPRIVVDRSNNIRWRWMAEPFGTTAAETNPSNLGALAFNLRFPGQYFDQESGLHYNYFRYYDPSNGGRYVQSDPIGLAGGVNTYSYVNGTPLMYIDPLGLFGWADMPTLPQGLVDFSAGFGDSMSFGITGYARAGLDIGSVNKCSSFYRGGELTDLAFETGTLGLAAGLKALAANASRTAARNGARPFVNAFREVQNLEGGFVHHSNPLFGHPGGIPTTFPTGGLPSAVNSGVWNLRWFADSASHSAAHRWMRGLENAWGGFVNPGTIAIRAARDAADTCTCQQ